MTRRMQYRNWAYEGYARARAKVDREKREGPEHHKNGIGARENSDQLAGQISLLTTGYSRDRQQDDENWFKRFQRANFRLRDLNDRDGFGDAAREVLRVCVVRNGARSFMWRIAP
jgi:hypothetical protein